MLAVFGGIIAVVFCASFAHKILLVLRGAANWHPIVLERTWLKAAPSAFVGLSAALDLAAASCLALVPPQGGAMSFALLAGYTYLLATTRSIRQGMSGCGCTGSLFDYGGALGAIVRNAVMGLVSLALVVVAPTPNLLAAASGACSALLIALGIRGSVGTGVSGSRRSGEYTFQ